jgi:prevent-host-death family protein
MYMRKTKNVVEARRDFPSILDGVERGDEVVVTRRGKPVGVLVPYAKYLRTRRISFGEALASWEAHPPEHLDGSEFVGLRDRSIGR